MDINTINSLVLSGGGMAAIVYLGVLGVLQDRGNRIKHITGTSMGAFFGCLFAMDVPMVEVDAYLRGYVQTLPFFPLEATMNLWEGLGIDDGDFLVKPLRYFINEKFGVEDMTMLEFAKATGKSFSICVSNITKHKRECISVDTHPNVLLTKAVLASMAIPMFIQPVEIEGDLYIDGALTSALPKTTNVVNSQSTLNIKVFLKLDNDIPPNTQPLVEYMSALIKTVFVTNDMDKSLIDSNNLVVLDACPLQSFPLSFRDDGFTFLIPEEKIKESIAYGRAKIEAALVV